MKFNTLALVAAAGLSLALIGCDDKKSPMASATDAAKSAAAKTGDAVKSAGDAAAKTASDATKAAGDMAAKAGEAAKGAADAAKKTLMDTVEKQWPAMKDQLTALSGKVAGITDAAKKTQAQGIVSDLQAKVPQLEGVVKQIKDSAAGVDVSGLITKAKDMFGSFTTKLGELTKLVG